MLSHLKNSSENRAAKLQRSIVIYSSIGILFVATVVAAVSILPMITTLEDTQRSTLNFSVKTTNMALNEYLSSSKEMAKQITTRTKIRQRLVEYNQGKLSYDDLTQFSKNALGDAMLGAEYVKGITRLDINGKKVVQVGFPIPKSYWRSTISDTSDVLVKGLFNIENQDMLLVHAPIVDRVHGRQGTDIVAIDPVPLSRIIMEHNPTASSAETLLVTKRNGKITKLYSTGQIHKGKSPEISDDIALEEALSQAFQNKEGLVHSSHTYDGDASRDHVIAFAPVPEANLVLAIKMDEAELNAAPRRLGIEVASIITVLIILGTLGMVLLIRPLTGRVLVHTDELKNKIADQTKELAKKEARLRAIVDHAADGVITVDRGGVIDLFNPAAERIFGVEHDDICGRRIHCLFLGDNTNNSKPIEGKYSKVFGEIVCTGQVEIQAVRTDGTIFPAEVTAGDVSLKDHCQRVYIVRDITERKQSEVELERRLAELKQTNETLNSTQAQLLQSEKMASIGQLAAGVAHEINNPVGYINSNVGTLKQYIDDIFVVIDGYQAIEDSNDDNELFGPVQQLKQQVDLSYLRDDLQDLINESQEGVFRVKQIVQDLKDFSHVDEVEWQWADLQKGLDSTLNVVRNEIKYKAEVEKKYDTLPMVECMPSQLNQVFMNFLVNAAHAIEGRGKITIQTEVKDGQVCISITDTGMGISAEVKEHIFEPFFTTKPVGKGTGLGLSLSYGIVKKHGGRIDVNSELGRGTTFRVWLPIRQSEDAGHSPAENNVA